MRREGRGRWEEGRGRWKGGSGIMECEFIETSKPIKTISTKWAMGWGTGLFHGTQL